MTTLSPRRDAMIAAAAEARTAAKALPPAKDRFEDIHREVSHSVLESALIPIAEAMDLGADVRITTGMLVSALANTIVSHCLSCGDGEGPAAERHAILLLNALIDQCRMSLGAPGDVEVVRNFQDAASGRAQ